MLQSRLERVNMAILNAVYPDMGLGGRATGSLDFEQASSESFPRADARLTITGFTRTTAASVRQPVDVNFAGKLDRKSVVVGKSVSVSGDLGGRRFHKKK